MDRVDVGGGRARVIDYKTGAPPRGGTSRPRSSSPASAMQPSLYILMAAEFLKKDGRSPDVDFSYLHVEEEGGRESGLTAESFAANPRVGDRDAEDRDRHDGRGQLSDPARTALQHVRRAVGLPEERQRLRPTARRGASSRCARRRTRRRRSE